MNQLPNKTPTYLPAFLALLTVLLLSDSDLRPVQPPAGPSTPPTSPTSTTSEPNGDEGPLTLQPVAVEEPEANRTGSFTQPRTINLPEGCGIKVFATGLQHVR